MLKSNTTLADQEDALPTLAAIEGQKAARELLNLYWPKENFPIDPFLIAKQLGIKVLSAQLPKEISGGFLKRAGYDPVILVSKEDSEFRQRFTCAHELGHYYRHKNDEADIDLVEYRGPLSATGQNEDEIFANQFAAALLMPEDAVRNSWKTHKSETALVEEFKVSLDAITFRLKNLGLIDS